MCILPRLREKQVKTWRKVTRRKFGKIIEAHFPNVEAITVLQMHDPLVNKKIIRNHSIYCV